MSGAFAAPAHGAEWWRADRAQPATAVSAPVASEARAAFPFVALLVFLGVMLLAPQAWFPALAPLRLALLCAGTAIAAHVADRLFRGRPLTVMTREVTLTAALAAWAFVTVPFATWPGGSLGFLLGTYLKSLAMFWLIANLASTSRRLRAVALMLTLASVPLAAVAVDHFLTGDIAKGGDYSESVKRIVGYDAPLTQNPNDLALMLNLMLPFAIATLLRARSGGARLALLGVIGLDAVGVVLTFSRAGFLTLALTLGLAWLVMVRGEARGWAIALLVLALAALPFLPGSYLSHMGTITDIRSDATGSAQARWDGMVSAAKIALRHPVFGAGAGMDVLALNREQGTGTWKEVHNVYLEYAVDLGLPGLALFVALFAASYGSARRAFRAAARTSGCEGLARDARAVRMSLVAFAVAAMFHPVGYHPYFYILAGLAVALATIARSEVPVVAH